MRWPGFRRRRGRWWCCAIWADLSVEQVGDVLGCAAGNVNRHDAHAPATLQAVLGEALAGPGWANRPGQEQPSQRESRDG
jgi:hypothetical protein